MDAIIYIILSGATGFILGTGIAFIFLWIYLIKKHENEKIILNEQLQISRESAVRLEVEKESLQKQITQNEADTKKMEAQFENLANRIFEDKSEKFKKQSQANINELLNPLKEKLSDFHKKVDDSFGQQAKEQFSLKEQIKNIISVNEKMSLQTENLTSALKGSSKMQGDWGEVILENILESSGLRKNEDYILQGKNLGIKNSENGQNQKPDVIINLPEGRHIIIDSKVTLRSYEQFCSETDESQKGAHLSQFLSHVRDRVKELEKRRYQDTEKLGTPEIVLMFMPIEGAFMLALQQDRGLHEFAWSKKVAIVCPSTLFATLKTIASLWRLELQNKNVQEIAKEGGALYDKVEGFVKDMQTLGKQIKTVESTYDNAMNKLSSGRGNILGKTEKLKLLGAKTSKALPAELIDTTNITEDEEKAA
ncbi:MAG: DNA recombination protein RmuC [Alphaproteobacteria bacterium]|nr:DNA recombination protein RmuC [Alphaproteobacteria bacterium]